MANGWFYKINGKQFGPVSLARLQMLVGNSSIGRDDTVRSADSQEWRRAASVGNLSDEFAVADSVHTSAELPHAAIAANPRCDVGRAGMIDESGFRMNCRCYCRLLGAVFGPMPVMNLDAMIGRGELSADDEVRFGEDGRWIPAATAGPLKPTFDRLIANKRAGNRSESAVVENPVATKNRFAEESALLPESRVGTETSAKKFAPVGRRPATIEAVTRSQRPAATWNGLLERLFELFTANRAVIAMIAVWGVLNVIVLGLPAGNVAQVKHLRTIPQGTIDRQFQEAYLAYLDADRQIRKLRSRNASEDEWREFAVSSARTLQPVLTGLKSSEDPAKVFLYRTGHTYLLAMLRHSDSNRGHLEWCFYRELNLAAQALEEAGLESSPF